MKNNDFFIKIHKKGFVYILRQHLYSKIGPSEIAKILELDGDLGVMQADEMIYLLGLMAIVDKVEMNMSKEEYMAYSEEELKNKGYSNLAQLIGSKMPTQPKIIEKNSDSFEKDYDLADFTNIERNNPQKRIATQQPQKQQKRIAKIIEDSGTGFGDSKKRYSKKELAAEQRRLFERAQEKRDVQLIGKMSAIKPE